MKCQETVKCGPLLFPAVFGARAEEVLEQADYLYSCAETEKLYRLLLHYKDR